MNWASLLFRRLIRGFPAVPRPPFRRPCVEELEPRWVPSTVPVAQPDVILYQGHAGASPSTVPSGGYGPSNLQQAYGFNQISGVSYTGANGEQLPGAGETIAIIDAYKDPYITSDLATYDSKYGVPAPGTSGAGTFTIVNENGGSSLSGIATNADWSLETSLDVETVHSLAPGANIILVEANSQSASDLMNAAAYWAGTKSGAEVVTMSFGWNLSPSELSYDSDFAQPSSGSYGVTYLAAAGDNSEPEGYPADSPNVVAVGGTELTTAANGNWSSETAWGDGTAGAEGGGGGISPYESKPAYQNVAGVNAVDPGNYRATPDVSFDADPNTGVAVYDSYYGWAQVGGTSLSSPAWAALIGITDQVRALNGEGPSLAGASQTLPGLYSILSTPSEYSSDFHDITTGSNGNPALVGYDLATGIGTPIANNLVPQLAAYDSVTPTAPTVTVNPTNQTVFAGQTATFTAAATGTPTPTVQWYVDINGTDTAISGATSTTLTLTNTTTSMSGNEYYAAFTNSAGTVDSTLATLTVNQPIAPTITSEPANVTVTAGQTATFTAAATGTPTPTVQWYVDINGTDTAISGATSTTLTLTNTTTSMSGNEYYAAFTNIGGTVNTTLATLTVNPPPAQTPVITTQPTSLTVSAGQTATFTAAATGTPTPTVQWYVDINGTDTAISGATSTTLTLTNTTTSMSGNEYYATFTNSAGSATTSAATLTVTAAPPSSTLFYGGDLPPSSNRNANGLSNEINTSISQASVYQNFVVPSGQTWTVAGLFSNNLISSGTSFGSSPVADWSIRSGVSNHNGGTVVASGTDASVAITPTGRTLTTSSYGTLTEDDFAVSGLNITLGAGTYWMNVTPVGTGSGYVFNSNTLGTNKVGTDIADEQFFTSTYYGVNFVNANNGGTFPDFSDGVIGTSASVNTSQSGGSNASTSTPVATTTTLTAMLNPGSSHQPTTVTFTITVAPQSGLTLPTGVIQLYYNGQLVGSANLVDNNGVETATITVLVDAPGTYNFTASYVGNSAFESSTSSLVSVTDSSPFSSW